MPVPSDFIPSIGLGLNGVSDFSTQTPFINLMNSARGWASGFGTGPDGSQLYTFAPDDEAPGSVALLGGQYLDDSGWVTDVPDDVPFLETYLLTAQAPEAQSLAGRYRVTYEGTGEIAVQSGATLESSDTGELWFDYDPAAGTEDDGVSLILRVLESDTNGTGDYIRNIAVVKEENIPLHEVGAVFNPAWVERIEDVRSVRFMDWMFTNGSPVVDWADRPTTDDFSYQWRGTPVEAMVDLANQLGVDPWFNMPHQATDEFMREFAEYVRDNLDPDLVVTVEYTNEAWNGIFPQNRYMAEQAVARWPDAVPPGEQADLFLAMEYFAARSADMSVIWNDAFGGSAESRLSVVMAPQPEIPELQDIIINADRWRAENPEHADTDLYDSYAANGYFGFSYGVRPFEEGAEGRAEEMLAQVTASIAAAEAEADQLGLTGAARETYVADRRFDEASDWLNAELRAEDLPAVRAEWEQNSAFAAANGLDLVMYEGGTHLTTVNTFEPELVAFFIEFNYGDLIGGLYETLLENWSDVGGTVFNAFVDMARPNSAGSWGALRHVDDETARWDSLLDVNEQELDWATDGREVSDFVNGHVVRGDDANNVLDGGAEEDFLVGASGRDVLSGAGGNDGLHGGRGADTLLGGDGDDLLLGAQGNDVLTGGAGSDTFVMRSGDREDRITDFNPEEDILIVNGVEIVDFDALAPGLSATMTNDELVISYGVGDNISFDFTSDLGAAYPNIYGGGIDGVVSGTAQNDRINAAFRDADGDQTNNEGQVIRANGGNDLIWDGRGDDTVYGNGGNDTFRGGFGVDTYHGGVGVDRVAYNRSQTGLTIDTSDGANSTGIAEGDILFGIERVLGTNYDDTMLVALDVGYGQRGDDRITDGAGRQVIFGGAGADTFVFGAGDGERDRIADFEAGIDLLDLTEWGVGDLSDLTVDYSQIDRRLILIRYEDEQMRVTLKTADPEFELGWEHLIVL